MKPHPTTLKLIKRFNQSWPESKAIFHASIQRLAYSSRPKLAQRILFEFKRFLESSHNKNPHCWQYHSWLWGLISYKERTSDYNDLLNLLYDGIHTTTHLVQSIKKVSHKLQRWLSQIVKIITPIALIKNATARHLNTCQFHPELGGYTEPPTFTQYPSICIQPTSDMPFHHFETVPQVVMIGEQHDLADGAQLQNDLMFLLNQNSSLISTLELGSGEAIDVSEPSLMNRIDEQAFQKAFVRFQYGIYYYNLKRLGIPLYNIDDEQVRDFIFSYPRKNIDQIIYNTMDIRNKIMAKRTLELIEKYQVNSMVAPNVLSQYGAFHTGVANYLLQCSNAKVTFIDASPTIKPNRASLEEKEIFREEALQLSMDYPTRFYFVNSDRAPSLSQFRSLLLHLAPSLDDETQFRVVFWFLYRQGATYFNPWFYQYVYHFNIIDNTPPTTTTICDHAGSRFMFFFSTSSRTIMRALDQEASQPEDSHFNRWCTNN